jgi:hypothetical protein
LCRVKIDQSTESDSNFSYRQTPPFLRFFVSWLFPLFARGVVSAVIGGFRRQSAVFGAPRDSNFYAERITPLLGAKLGEPL